MISTGRGKRSRTDGKRFHSGLQKAHGVGWAWGCHNSPPWAATQHEETARLNVRCTGDGASPAFARRWGADLSQPSQGHTRRLGRSAKQSTCGARVTARCGDGVLDPRRAEQRGGRTPEHVHEPRCVAWHCPCGIRSHREPDRELPERHRAQSSRAERDRLTGDDATVRRHALHLRRPAPAGFDKAHVPPETSAAIIDENATARIKSLWTSLGVLAMLSVPSLFFSRRIPSEQADPSWQPCSRKCA